METTGRGFSVDGHWLRTNQHAAVVRWESRSVVDPDLAVCLTQRLQNPLIKEYTLNLLKVPIIF